MTEEKEPIDPLLWVRQELNVPKKHHNSFGGFNYRTAEDILEAVKPLCAEVGAQLSITDDINIVGETLPVTVGQRQGKNGTEDFLLDGPRVYVTTTAKFIPKDGKPTKAKGHAREPIEKKGMDEPQITGTAASYALKRALGNLFLIDDNKDSDDLPQADDDQINEWIDRVDSKDIYWLYNLKNTDYPLYQALLRDAPGRGEKTRYKRLVGELVHEAYTNCAEQAKALVGLADRKDVDGIKEITGELDGNMKAGVWFCLPDPVKRQIQQLLTGAE